MSNVLKAQSTDNVSPKAWREVNRHILMSLLKTVILANVMQVIPSDDDGPLHLHLGHHT